MKDDLGMEMKPERFSGTRSIDSNITYFTIFARANNWSEEQRSNVNRCNLTCNAIHILWNTGEDVDWTYDELCSNFRQCYGSAGQTQALKAELNTRIQ